MAARVGALARQLLVQPCAGVAPPSGPGAASHASFESPAGTQYPPGTVVALMGNMEPVDAEVEGALVAIHGALPVDLDGQYIRTGPNPFMSEFGNRKYHEFSGDGMLHSSDLRRGAGTFRNRWVRTLRKTKEEALGRSLKMNESMTADGLYLGAANTNLAYHASQLLALYEGDRPYIVSVPELETVGQMTYNGGLQHNMTAHPKVCPLTGELVFFGYDLFKPMVYYTVASTAGELGRTVEVPTCGGKPVMMHDMAITERYSILLEFPLYFDIGMARQGKMPYVHDTALPSMFGILPRHAANSAEVRWFQGKSAMSFHIANAWEVGESVKLIGCPQDNFSFDYQASSPSRLFEWTFDLSTGATSERQLDTTHVEFPVIHPRMVGRQNRYIWAAAFSGSSPSPFHAICGCVKYDLVTGRHLRHDFIGGRWGGESVFAPRSDAEGSDEDDGYLLTYTYNPADKTTELYVVDARTMDPDPVAILRTPQRVPFGFHGLWLSRRAE